MRRRKPPPPQPPAGGPMTRRMKLMEPKPPPEDRLSDLPDGVLGEIVSLLPTKDGARTQILASRWRHIWRSSPLNIDYRDLTGANKHDKRRVVGEAISRILSTHGGPTRRLSMKRYRFSFPSSPHDAWLDSPILDGLQEIEFWFVKYYYGCTIPLRPSVRPSVYRFSASLRVATFGGCLILDDAVQGLRFPYLKQLALEYVSISEPSLHSLIAGCPALEGLLIHSSFGFRLLRIHSLTLTSICVRIQEPNATDKGQFEELVVESAPCLERLITLYFFRGLRVSVISAPKLHTLGFLTDFENHSTTLLFGAMVIQGLQVGGIATAVHTVKVLAVNKQKLSLDNVVDLIRFFPCLEKLHVKSWGSGDKNLWRRKHGNLVKSLNLRLKTIVLDSYTGTWSHINFATFFVLNARLLELMTFHVDAKVCNEEFLADQRTKLQLKDRASRGAQFRFTTQTCLQDAWCTKHLRDFDLNDPFACRC